MLWALGDVMAAIRYGIAGRPVDHSLSPLLTALVVKHLGLVSDDKHLRMELVDVSSVTDAFAWGYAGAVPEPIPWAYTQSMFNKFRTKALLSKAVEAATQVVQCHSKLATVHPAPVDLRPSDAGLPTRMFDEEIWLNLTAPLKHQLDSGAVMAVDDCMVNKCVNALRWDGRGWWCAGVDGAGVLDALAHHGIAPDAHVLGLVGGGGAARSTATAWAEAGGRLQQLPSKRALEEGAWSESMTDQPPSVFVDFDGSLDGRDDALVLKSTYKPMTGSMDERVDAITSGGLDGRWLLVAQHLACWRRLWAPERRGDLPDLGLLLTQLLEAECVLSSYA